MPDDFATSTRGRRTREEGPLSPDYWRLTVGIVSVVLLVAFEAMAVATAMPVAVRALHGLASYAFAFSAFLSASLVGMVLSGQVCDRSGPRVPLLTGVGLFAAGLVAAGTAGTMTLFVLARAVQGFGGGLNIVALYVVVGRSYPESMRPRVFSAMSAAWVLPSIVGPLVAGALSDAVSWRAVFLAVPPLVVPAVLLVLPRLRELGPPPRDASAVLPGRRNRLLLAVAAAAGAATLQYAGGHLEPSSLVLVAVALGLLAVSVPRLLPPGTLRARRGLPAVIGLRGLIAGSFFGAESFLPLMLVEQRGLSTTLAGLVLTGAALGWAAGSWVQGRSRFAATRSQLVQAGTGVIVTGIAALALVLLPAVPPALAGLAWLVGGAGMGVAMSGVSVLVLELSPVEDQGANSAALQVSDGLGSIVFIAGAATLFAWLHPGAPRTAYVSIFLAMAAVAAVGIFVAGRTRARGAHPVALAAPEPALRDTP